MSYVLVGGVASRLEAWSAADPVCWASSARVLAIAACARASAALTVSGLCAVLLGPSGSFCLRHGHRRVPERLARAALHLVAPSFTPVSRVSSSSLLSSSTTQLPALLFSRVQ